MARRSFKIIAVSPTTLEGVGVRGSEAQLETAVSRRFPQAEEDFFANLSGQADQALLGEGWRNSQVVLIFPSHEISLRKLEFPFRDPKKIDQALVFELENELLEDVNNFVFSYTIVPEEGDYTSVLVYLVPIKYLHGYLDIVQERQLTPVHITFSAQALHQLHQPAGPLHYQVYLGADEAYASCISGGSVQAVKSFTLDPTPFFPPAGEGEAEAAFSGETGPADLLQSMQGAPDGAEEGAPAAAAHWRGEFEELAAEVTRFIGPHSLGREYTVSVHGLFAPFFEWEDEAARLRVLPPEQASVPFGRPSFWGIMEEVAGEPRSLVASTGVNFFRNQTGVGQQLREFRSPLTVMGLVAMLFLLLFSVNFGMRIADHQETLERLDGKIEALLKKTVQGKRSVVQSMRILDERLAKLKKESAASARFTPYMYGTMNLMEELSLLYQDSPELTLNALTLKGERFTVSGTTKSYNASESFKNRLAKMKRFNGTEPIITHQRTQSGITYRIVINKNAP